MVFATATGLLMDYSLCFGLGYFLTCSSSSNEPRKMGTAPEHEQAVSPAESAGQLKLSRVVRHHMSVALPPVSYGSCTTFKRGISEGDFQMTSFRREFSDRHFHNGPIRRGLSEGDFQKGIFTSEFSRRTFHK